jgi:hypothetical protein
MSLRQVTPNMDNGSVNQGGEHGGTVAFMSALLHNTMYLCRDQRHPLIMMWEQDTRMRVRIQSHKLQGKLQAGLDTC